MPPRVPKYRLHKGTGQALVQIRGERIYLGKYDSDESHQRYRRLVAEYLTNGSVKDAQPPQNAPGTPLTISELICSFWVFSLSYYVKHGEPTGEHYGIRAALRPLRALYGQTLAKDFGPKAFKLVREEFVRAGKSRRYTNDCMSRVKRMFRWAAEEELVPATVYHSLKPVAGLKRGRSQARETEPVAPVPDVNGNSK